MNEVAAFSAKRMHYSWDKGIDLDGEWEAICTKDCVRARNLIIETYLPFARMMAAKIYGRRSHDELEFNDYFQHATIGLIESVDRFDYRRGIKFETFASLRITGAILNGISTLSEEREQIGARARLIQDRVKSISGEKPILDQSEMLFTHLAELAIGLAVGFMLENSGMYQDNVATYVDDTYNRVEYMQLQERLNGCVEKLPDNERRVILYHYRQGLSFKEISTLLQLSDGRTSQIHKAAVTRLRRALDANEQLNLKC